jgi:hypothetical protein
MRKGKVCDAERKRTRCG